MRKPGALLKKSLCICGLLLAATSAIYSQNAERKLIKKVAPEYPSILREKRIHGTVKLSVVVKADGSVKDVVVIGGNPALVDSSIRAVKQWKYAPSDHESTIEVTIQFDPNNSQ